MLNEAMVVDPQPEWAGSRGRLPARRAPRIGQDRVGAKHVVGTPVFDTVAPAVTSGAAPPVWPSLSIPEAFGVGVERGGQHGGGGRWDGVSASIPGSRKGRAIPGRIEEHAIRADRGVHLVDAALGRRNHRQRVDVHSHRFESARVVQLNRMDWCPRRLARRAGKLWPGCGLETVTPINWVTGGLFVSSSGRNSTTVPRT